MNNKVINTLFVTTIFLFCSSCGNRQAQQHTRMIVKTASTTIVEDNTYKEFPFISKPLRTSELSFRVSGPVDRFDAYAGNSYTRGNIIAEIDPRDFRLRKEHSEATYRQAKTEYERIEALYQKNNISASTYEKTRADYVAAKTAYEKSVNELDDTRLLAPFDGYVGEVYIEKFQDVRVAQPIVSFVDISQLRIEVYITQNIVMQAGKLHNVSLSFDARPNEVFNAKVIDFARSTTPNNLSYLLTALLPNPDGKLPAGMSGKVFFNLPHATEAVVSIPQTALCNQPTYGNYVWVIDSENRVSRRAIIPGTLQPGGLFSVVSGLKADEIVVTSGLRFLSDGMIVETEDRPTATQPLAKNNK